MRVSFSILVSCAVSGSGWSGWDLKEEFNVDWIISIGGCSLNKERCAFTKVCKNAAGDVISRESGDREDGKSCGSQRSCSGGQCVPHHDSTVTDEPPLCMIGDSPCSSMQACDSAGELEFLSFSQSTGLDGSMCWFGSGFCKDGECVKPETPTTTTTTTTVKTTTITVITVVDDGVENLSDPVSHSVISAMLSIGFLL